MKQDRIQITSRMPFCKLHKIKHLDKMRLLCPRNNGGAKQGGFCICLIISMLLGVSLLVICMMSWNQ